MRTLDGMTQILDEEGRAIIAPTPIFRNLRERDTILIRGQNDDVEALIEIVRRRIHKNVGVQNGTAWISTVLAKPIPIVGVLLSAVGPNFEFTNADGQMIYHAQVMPRWIEPGDTFTHGCDDNGKPSRVFELLDAPWRHVAIKANGQLGMRSVVPVKEIAQ